MDLEDLKNTSIDYAELARLMGYSRNHINQVMLGKRRVTKKFLFMLNKVSCDELTSKYAKRSESRKKFKSDN